MIEICVILLMDRMMMKMTEMMTMVANLVVARAYCPWYKDGEPGVLGIEH